MAKTASQYELERLLRNPKITFEKGLLNTPNDSFLGYVSDLKNMEIEDGVVQNRLGSYHLIPSTNDYSWLSITEHLVCDVQVLMLINRQREVYFVIEAFPERLIPVYKYGVDPLSDDSFRLKFYDGTKFHVVENKQYLYIYSNTGTGYRIDKVNFIMFANTYDHGEYVDLAQNIIDHDDSLEIGAYVVIDDMTFHGNVDIKAVPAEYKSVPIRGKYRYAEVNKAGITGQWSDPFDLGSEYGKYLFSRYGGTAVRLTDGDKLLSENTLDGFGLEVKADQYTAFVNSEGIVEDFDQFAVDASANYEWASATLVVKQNGSGEVVFASTGETETETTSDQLYITDSNGCILVKDLTEVTPLDSAYCAIASVEATTPASEYFTVDLVPYYVDSADTSADAITFSEKYWKKRVGELVVIPNLEATIEGTAPTEVATKYEVVSVGHSASSVILKLKAAATVSFTTYTYSSGDYFLVYSPTYGLNATTEGQYMMPLSSVETGYTGDYQGLIALAQYKKVGTNAIPQFSDGMVFGCLNNPLTHDYSGRKKYIVSVPESITEGASSTPFRFYDDRTTPGDALADGDPVQLYSCKVAALRTALWPAKAAYIFNKEALFLDTSLVTLMKERDVNTWDYGLSSVEYVKISEHLNVVIGLAESSNNSDVVLLQEADGLNELFLKNGFKVWHDGNIICESQKVFSLNKRPQYSLNAISTRLSQRYLESTSAFDIRFASAASLTLSSILSYPYEIDEFVKEIRQPDLMCVGSGSLFVVEQDGAVQIGSLSDMLLRKKVDVPYSVVAMEPVGGGVVIFGEKEINYITDDGAYRYIDTTSVRSSKIIATASGAGSAFAINENNDVIVLATQYSETGQPYVVLNVISRALKSVAFASDASMTFCRATLWIASDDSIYGFSDGVWSKKYQWDGKHIKNIGTLGGELVVSFEDFYEPSYWWDPVDPKPPIEGLEDIE